MQGKSGGTEPAVAQPCAHIHSPHCKQGPAACAAWGAPAWGQGCLGLRGAVLGGPGLGSSLQGTCITSPVPIVGLQGSCTTSPVLIVGLSSPGCREHVQPSLCPLWGSRLQGICITCPVLTMGLSSPGRAAQPHL